ncbi:hypothetical protein D3C78_876180 [compost metagenome]
MLRGCTRMPMPALAAAVSPLRLPQVQTIRQERPARSNASCAAFRVMLGGGKAISGRASGWFSMRSGSRASQTSGSR